MATRKRLEPTTAPREVHLGDGAYARTDGHTIELTTRNGIGISNRIVLEREVMLALIRFTRAHFPEVLT